MIHNLPSKLKNQESFNNLWMLKISIGILLFVSLRSFAPDRVPPNQIRRENSVESRCVSAYFIQQQHAIIHITGGLTRSYWRALLQINSQIKTWLFNLHHILTVGALCFWKKMGLFVIKGFSQNYSVLILSSNTASKCISELTCA